MDPHLNLCGAAALLFATVPVASHAILVKRRGRMENQIELTLLDLSSSSGDGDEKHQLTKASSVFVNQVNDILDALSCCKASVWLQQQQHGNHHNNIDNDADDDMATRAKLRIDIMRYVKQRDAHLALASILLKSRAFHQTHQQQSHNDRDYDYSDVAHQQSGTQQQQQCRRHPLMDLPRTKHNKPFIPMNRTGGGDDQQDDDDIHTVPISVSHQYPFCGLVRFVPKRPEEKNKQSRHINSPLLLLGLDIVCFDIVQPKDQHDVKSFVDIFCSNFAPAEWDIIHAAATDNQQQQHHGNTNGGNNGDWMMLREFCIRWAVKEAYTKALGVGLGFDFASFQVVFEHEDLQVCNNKDSSSKDDLTTMTTRNSNDPFFLYQWLLDNVSKNKNYDSNHRYQQQLQQTLVGTVVLVTTPPETKKTKQSPDPPSSSDEIVFNRPRREEWMFSFQLLYKRKQPPLTPFGCACTAWGPLPPPSDASPEKDTTSPIHVENQWTTVDELVAWHINT
jgi:phosphopantetheinyl transferase (holo-ACP synthase)